jgi:hypothetical protein
LNAERRQEIKVSIAALGILAMVSMPVIGWGLWTWSNVNLLASRVARNESDLRELDTVIAGLIVEANSNSQHRIFHEKEAQSWQQRIIANEERAKAYEKRLDALEQQ